MTDLRYSTGEKLGQFQVTKIEFDFDPEFTEQNRAELYEETIGSVWEAIDGDDLVEQITGWCGWCIKSIDYRVVT